MIRHLLALAIVLCPAGVFAEESGKKPGETPEIRKLLEKVRALYRTASSYRDEYVQDLDLAGEGTDRLNTGQAQKQKLAFTAPDRIRLEAADYTIVCSGRKLWEHVVPLEQYIEKPSPHRLDLDDLALAQFEAFKDGRHPIAVLLTNAKADFLNVLGEVTAFQDLKPETRSGTAGALLSGTANLPLNGGPSIEVPFRAWFDDQGLLREIGYDLTKRYQDLLELRGLSRDGIKLTRAVQRRRFIGAVVNEPVSPEVFTYKPGPYDRKVEAFQSVSQQEMQQRLIGRPAPAFNVFDLHGKRVALSDFRGQVVMLDFWSTTCGPCIMSFPHIEELSGRYAKQPVAILGVNGDSLPPLPAAAASQPAARFEPIARFLKAKKVTYRQLMDVDSEISEAYRVGGIPCVILVDKKGVIRAIHMGYRADAVKAYGADIDRLLKEEGLTRGGTATQAAGN